MKPVQTFQVHTAKDLTEETLSDIFSDYYPSDASDGVDVKIRADNQTFTADDDGLQSDIKKWTVDINLGDENRELSFIVKTSLTSSFHKFNSRISRQFFSETFWYKHALPVRIIIVLNCKQGLQNHLCRF